MKLPNFFIAGAPKCGTTALYHCLRNHPDIYLPYSKDVYWLYKEPNHFCGDLGLADWLRVDDKNAYGKLFEAAGDASKIGEATALYLYSSEAAHRIHERCGSGVKVIVLLRPPVSWMRSWHHDMLRWGYEDIADFKEAIDAGPARARGELLPKRPAFAGCMDYRKAACFSGQVERMFDEFGKENVFVGLMEDLQRERKAFVAKVLRFLEADDSYVPEPKRKNDSPDLLATHLFDLKVARVTDRIPGGSFAKTAWGKGPGKIYKKAVEKLLPPLSDKSIEPALQRQLDEEFREEVLSLGSLIGRDLSHWSSSAPY